jgi:hypothetical protein
MLRTPFKASHRAGSVPCSGGIQNEITYRGETP